MSMAYKPLRSPLTWFGGKGHLARHIVPLLPPHEAYVEPFFGGGSLFFAKPRARLETVNDLDGCVVRFYRVLRDPLAFERFRVLCELTPYAREEYEECRDTWGDVGDVGASTYRAWAWFVGVRQAFGGATGSAARHGWKYSVAAPHSRVGVASAPGTWGYSARNANGTRVASSAQRYLSAVERVPEVDQRLQGVPIERGDWRRVLAAYGHAGVLCYIDPPYVWETRRGDKRYAHEMTTEDHHELTEALLRSPAMVALSGYRHEAVHRPLEDAGWERTDIDVPISAAPPGGFTPGREYLEKSSGCGGVGARPRATVALRGARPISAAPRTEAGRARWLARRGVIAQILHVPPVEREPAWPLEVGARGGDGREVAASDGTRQGGAAHREDGHGLVYPDDGVVVYGPTVTHDASPPLYRITEAL